VLNFYLRILKNYQSRVLNVVIFDVGYTIIEINVRRFCCYFEV